MKIGGSERTSVHSRAMISALLASALFAPIAQPAQRFTDKDKDGLYDLWETEGFGPLDPKIHGCRPDHSDIIICFRIRPGMTEATMKPTIDRMRRFYSEMPYTNPDGTKGLNLIAIVLPPLGEEFNSKGYNELYEVGMPKEWRGLAHGVMVDNHGGGGGQANRPDWCGTGYNFWTITHEVGHQLGLPHGPLATEIGSPFHTSLMNYDYSYQLGGDAEKVRFSDGRFAKLRLSEKSLDENIPFPAEEFDFLTKRPHFYSVKKVDDKNCQIDWNRNGIFGEKGYQSNINDGYAVEFRSTLKGSRATGSPALANVQGELYCTAPEGGKEDGPLPTLDAPAKLGVHWVNKEGKFIRAYEGKDPIVTGPVSALGVKGQLWVAHSTKSGWNLSTFRHPIKPEQEPIIRSFEEGSDPLLLLVNGRASALVRDAKSGQFSLIDLSSKETKPESLGLTSLQGAAACWNEAKKRLGVVTVEDRDKAPGVMVLHELIKGAKGWESAAKPITVGGDASPGRTGARPILSMANGMYQVHCKGWYEKPEQPGLNFLCRQIATGTGWWIKMMGNEWANSRSVCSIVPYDGDVAYAYRWYGGPEDNSIWLHKKGSGIDEGIISDFDEVSFIFEQGLQNSLKAVRDEQWRRKR